jgi:hypothetical protein
LATFFVYEDFGWVMVKFRQKIGFYTGRDDLPEMLIQQMVEFPTAVTRKSLTV